MKVSDILRRLSLGPLSNLSMANEGDGTIVPAKVPAVINNLNDALKRVYTRFTLSERTMILLLQANVTNYRLESKYAFSRKDEFPELTPHIMDRVHPFKDDLVKVLTVAINNNRQLALNDDNAPRSLFTPQVNVLQVPDPVAGVPLYLTYQALHPRLDETGPDVLDQNVDLPAVLEDAVLSYIAHKIFFAMSGQEHAVIAAGHLNSYESVCNEVTSNDLVSQSVAPSNIKFHDRGFV